MEMLQLEMVFRAAACRRGPMASSIRIRPPEDHRAGEGDALPTAGEFVDAPVAVEAAEFHHVERCCQLRWPVWTSADAAP